MFIEPELTGRAQSIRSDTPSRPDFLNAGPVIYLRLDESLSATKHFLQSLKTPNDELRYKNSYDHRELYRKLPPAERDFVYQRATEQKDHLESTARRVFEEQGVQTQTALKNLHGELKAELLALSLSGADPMLIKDRASVILEEYLGDRGNVSLSAKVAQLSQELSEIVLERNTRMFQHERTPLSTKASHDLHQGSSGHDIRPAQTR
ncbi:MAG: hypothetical protein PSX80_04060 [bacterium]|nr:hypothetical protein [bacterium]